MWPAPSLLLGWHTDAKSGTNRIVRSHLHCTLYEKRWWAWLIRARPDRNRVAMARLKGNERFDQYGRIPDLLPAAPKAMPVCSRVAALVSIDDVADRPARPLADGAMHGSARRGDGATVLRAPARSLIGHGRTMQGISRSDCRLPALPRGPVQPGTCYANLAVAPTRRSFSRRSRNGQQLVRDRPSTPRPSPETGRGTRARREAAPSPAARPPSQRIRRRTAPTRRVP